ncbi:hypothetical protein F5878DRAFT_426022 [Lentinula raphanica]|uniref:Uncharacterized protein n=1 Tax=Lentinula raphanica TaxID=153919 RepID=A0AA38NYQ8_9AGAR|nr:hypothetical protein F5878DRAFT_426022 [Lentinula raphanica]
MRRNVKRSSSNFSNCPRALLFHPVDCFLTFQKRFLSDKEEEIESWLHNLQVEHRRLASEPASESASKQMTTLISRHEASLNRLFSITYGRKKPQYVPAMRTQMITLWETFQSSVRVEMEKHYHSLEYLKSDWELACHNDAHSSGEHARRKVFDDYRQSAPYLYDLTHTALQLQALRSDYLKPYEEIFAGWHEYYGLPKPFRD